MASATQVSFSINHFLTFSSSPILDVRNEQAFAANHITDSCNIPLDSLSDRIHELPLRKQSLRIICKEVDSERVTNLLKEKGYQIAACLHWSLQVETILSEKQQLQKNDSSVRLWQPALIIKEFVEQLHQGQVGTVLDIGCGSGRDAVYMALRGWQVTAVDYLPRMIDKLNALASYNNVQVTGVLLDLETDRGLSKIDKKFDVITVIRYLHRPLFKEMSRMINSGGYIIYQTFLEGCEVFGKPKNPRFLLKPGELAEVFDGFKIIKDRVEYLDDGRPTQVFIAQKP